MKRIYLYLVFTLVLIFFRNENISAQATCQGSILASDLAEHTATTTIGNGTAGCVRVCITNNTLGTSMCSGLQERIIVRNSANTIVAQWFNTTANGTCITMTLNDGYARVSKLCITGDATITWETIDCSTGTNVCCTPSASLCSNGVVDCGEEGIDCGGACPITCGESCSDNIQNQGETGIDCGGPCPACGSPCVTVTTVSQTGIVGGIVDGTTGDKVINSCVTLRYSNTGSNWIHGIAVNPSATGFLSSTGSGTPPAAVSTMGTTYTWTYTTANFTSSNSGQSITNDGWYVETGNTNRGDNLGWPVAAGTTLGPFCFNTTLSCSAGGGITGNVAGTFNFVFTSDSYSGAWTNNSCAQEVSSGTASWSYTLQCPTSLSIDMLNFKVRAMDKYPLLLWKVANPQDVSRYVIQVSEDGNIFKDLATEKPNGKKEQSFVDKSFKGSSAVYRIKVYDNKGEFNYSSIEKIIMDENKDKDMGVSVMPNPNTGEFVLNFLSAIEEKVNVEIYSISGQLIKSEVVYSTIGENNLDVNLSGIAKGSYFIKVVQTDAILNTKLTIQ
jgi:hypothetical protein